MEYETFWLDEAQTLLCTRFHGHITWDMYVEAIDEGVATSTAHTTPHIHLIDLRSMDALPTPRGGLKHFHHFAETHKANQHRVMEIQVGKNDRLTNTIREIFKRTYNIETLTAVNTWEEAMQLAAHYLSDSAQSD